MNPTTVFRLHHDFTINFTTASGFVANQTMNSTTVSGSAQPHDELRRQSQALCTCPHNICGASQALCTPVVSFADSLRLSAPPLVTFAERLRLCADPRHYSQALRPPRRPALAPRMLRQSQALRTPMMNCAGRLRLGALPRITCAERLRLCAPP